MNCYQNLPSGRALTLIGLMLLLGPVLVGCTPDVSELRAEGIRYFRNHRHIESMATFRHALELAPNDALSNYYMGLNYRRVADRKFHEDDAVAAYRELDTSILYFTQAIKSWPNYMEAIAAKNEALEARGKYEQALHLAGDVTTNTRGYASDHFIYLGNEYRDRGDYDNALRAYKTALAGNPGSAQAYAAMGKLYKQVGDLALAKDAYRRAYELDRNAPEVASELQGLELESGIYHASDGSAP